MQEYKTIIEFLRNRIKPQYRINKTTHSYLIVDDITEEHILKQIKDVENDYPNASIEYIQTIIIYRHNTLIMSKSSPNINFDDYESYLTIFNDIPLYVDFPNREDWIILLMTIIIDYKREDKEYAKSARIFANKNINKISNTIDFIRKNNILFEEDFNKADIFMRENIELLKYQQYFNKKELISSNSLNPLIITYETLNIEKLRLEELAQTRKTSKERLKTYLYDLNKKYNLNKAHKIKEFIDSV